MNKFVFIFAITSLLNTITYVEASLANNKVVVKSIKCKNHVNYIHNFTCILKPTRNGPGNVTIHAFVAKPMYDLWLHLSVYYKYRVFQKFMGTFDVNVCEFASDGTNESVI